ncbi:MAG: thiamine-phosphate kinase [Chitinispirillales bacterium]|jgi:thiamine-monophosphate kinase|nr:thiamine-phosphate kinase [Chitinispirillales bacterium]
MNNLHLPSNEYGLIRRIQKFLPSIPRTQTSYEEMIGDDAAIRLNSILGERLVITADISVENVHFSLSAMSLEEVGYRAMVSNLSDCAAMGALPDSALVQLVFPKNCPDVGACVENVYKGIGAACARWRFPVVGGDLSGGSEWTIGITLIGSAAPEQRVVKRTGICAGDVLWVTGMPGESAAGLAVLSRFGRDEKYRKFINAHISPVPRIQEGRSLASCPQVHSMMDLSDGLSKDIATLCFDNNLGFLFDKADEEYVSSDMSSLASELGLDWKEWFFHGGEEYELLFACDSSFDISLLKRFDDIEPLRLGFFTAEFSGVRLKQGGSSVELPRLGWDHARVDQT